MVYNLYEWLLVEFPALSMYPNGFLASSPDSAIEINEGSGEDQDFFNRQDKVIQFISRANCKPEARKTAIDLYNFTRKKYGCLLPEITVDGVLYPAITAWAFRPVNSPQYTGDDDNGRHLFSFSIEVTTTIENIQ